MAEKKTQRSAFDVRLSPEDRPGAQVQPKKARAQSQKATQKGPAKPRKKAAGAAEKAAPKKGAPSRSGNGAGRGRRKAGKTTPVRRHWLVRLVRFSVYWSLVLGLWGAIGALGIMGYYAAKLPQTSEWQVPKRPPNIRIVDINGRVLAVRGKMGGENVSISQLPPYLPEAVMAIEDRRFHYHLGVDPIGLVRAFVTNLRAGRVVQGGSTLTQQLAKNLFLKPERTFERKVQEVVLAFWLEAKYTKNELMELYLNRVYLGAGAYGVEAASRRYFNKSARHVTLAEAAVLAGLLKAPSTYAPNRNPKRSQARAQTVLHAMADEDYITEREALIALANPATAVRRKSLAAGNYVADWVMEQLPGLIGDVQDDLIIDTTIDTTLQKNADNAIRQALRKNGKTLRVSQGALVTMDGTGAVRALVGGRSYSESQFNRAVNAKRQPGSAFKPFVYLTALEQGLTPETERIDGKIRIGKWTPENYDNQYRGRVTLREALAKSLNTVAAHLAYQVGPKNVVKTARRLGIRSDIKANPSLALGTSEVTLLELTTAYIPFSNGGYGALPHVIKRIRTDKGKTLYQRKGSGIGRVVAARNVGMMNAMMQETLKTGTAKRASIRGWQAAGKTGTTQSYRDALFVGYTANLVTGIWFGNDNGKPTRKATGGKLPAKVFANFMNKAHRGVPVASLPGNYKAPVRLVSPAARPAGRVREHTTADGRPGMVRRTPKADDGGKSLLNLLFGGG